MSDAVVDAMMVDQMDDLIRRTRADQREADAAKVRAAGCACHALEWGTDDFQGVLRWVSEDRQELESHDPRCPHALADLILEGGA